MDTIFRTAYVYVRNVFAGTLLETDKGYSFSYDQTYLKDAQASAVSLTLPLTDEVYESKTMFPFFDGLIPEGWLLGVVSRNWKIDGINSKRVYGSGGTKEIIVTFAVRK